MTAEIAMRMTAVGVPAEICTGCDTNFNRGQRMNAVVDSDDREPCGWFCDSCIDAWKTKGTESRPARRAAGLDQPQTEETP